MFTKSLLLCALLAPMLAQAAELDYGHAVQAALQNSPKVQRSKSVLEETSWKRVEAFSTYYPTVTAGVSYLTDYKYMLTDINFGGAPVTVPAIVPTTNYTVQAQYLLFDGFASTNRYLASRAMERSSQKDYEWTKFQVEREVGLQFYKALASKILVEVAQQNIKTLQDHQKDVGLFKKAGISTNYDVLRVDVQVSEAQSEVLNAQDNAEVARGRLAELLGQEDTPEVTGKLPVLKPELIQGLKNDSLARRADLISLQEKVQGLDDLDSAASRHWIPRVGLFATYQSYNNLNDRFDDASAFRDAYQVGVSATWAFFDGFASTAKAKQSVEEKFQAEKGLQLAKLKAKQDLDYWKRKYLYYCTVYRSRLSDIEKSKESVRLAREGRRVGARTNTDLLDAEGELYRAQAGAVNAQIGAIEALINLELATGQQLAQLN